MSARSQGARAGGGMEARDCPKHAQVTTANSLPLPSHALTIAREGGRVFRCEFGASCIIQGPPPRPGSCLHEGGRTSASEGAALWTRAGHPKFAPRSRKPRPTPGCTVEQKASQSIGEDARTGDLESLSRLWARALGGAVRPDARGALPPRVHLGPVGEPSWRARRKARRACTGK